MILYGTVVQLLTVRFSRTMHKPK